MHQYIVGGYSLRLNYCFITFFQLAVSKLRGVFEVDKHDCVFIFINCSWYIMNVKINKKHVIFWVTHYFFAGRKTLGCRNTHLFISWLLILHLLLPSDSTLNTQTDSIADDRGLLIASKYSQDLHTNIFLKWNISNQLNFSLLRSTRISLDNISVGHSFSM